LRQRWSEGGEEVNEVVVELEEVTKRFGAVVAVDNLSLKIMRGEVFGLLGPNGAGKTTTVRMICGLLRPTSGRVLVFGYEMPREALKARRHIGLLPQESDVYEMLTGRENLEYFGRLYGLEGEELRRRVDEALELVGLTERADDRAGEYSGGMKRRLMVARAIVHDPELVILDEPTMGLDVFAVRRIRRLIRRLAEGGRTVLLTTNDLEDAERTCDRVAIIDKGRLVALGTIRELEEEFEEKGLEELFVRLVEGEG